MKWEAIAVLHAAGNGLEPEDLLKKHSVANATAYREGEAAAGGRKHTLSGFKVDLGAAASKVALEQQVLKHLQDYSALYADVAKHGGHLSLGIGLMVPPKEPRTVTFTPDALAVLLDAKGPLKNKSTFHERV